MNLLMLRGEVPNDRDPQEIVFDTIEKCDDVWSNLFFSMVDKEDIGELWYWNGNREHKFAENFTERWVPNFATYKSDFIPDVIFCRGGFPEYHSVLKRFPNAISIYYGAGRRFLPQPGFINYDIILQDSPEQAELCRNRFPSSFTTLFIKPAADNIFYSMEGEIEYDICFPANGRQSFKGHDFVYSTVPNDLKLLNLGNPSKVQKPNNVTSYRVLRKDMAKNISKCKVGIVTANSPIDSCPRIIPELLACGLPIVVLNGTRFWKDKYIVPGVTGEIANKENFWLMVKHVLNNADNYNPRKYYKDNLAVTHAANFIKKLIKRS